MDNIAPMVLKTCRIVILMVIQTTFDYTLDFPGPLQV